MKALYRKYRPRTLAEVVGQEQVTKVLAKSLEKGKISHAYLFVGPRGTGKTSVARILAHEVNDFEYKLEDNYIDIIEIDGASNRGIDNIRELREKANIAPTSGKYKVYIIDEVHMLTKEAFNALLKTLEEPPKHVIFIMATTDVYKVPITITSRAQTYSFKLADPKIMLEHLKSIAQKEKIKITDEALKIVVSRGGGSFRDSLSLLDQISSLSSKEITKELVVAAMGLPEDEKIDRLLKEYQRHDVVKITTIFKELLSSGIEPETLAEELIRTIIAQPKAGLLNLLARLPDVKNPFAEAKLLVCLTEPCLNAEFSSAPQTSSASVQPSKTAKSDKTPELEKAPIPKKAPEKALEKAPAPEKAPEKAPELKKTDFESTEDFSWQEFLVKIKSLNSALHQQLNKSKYELSTETLHIYPKNKTIYEFLTRTKNKQTLVANAKTLKIDIHKPGERPKINIEDATLNKFSDIMGGEVENYEGGNDPF